MSKQRILYVSPEIAPYLPANPNAQLGHDLPHAMHQRKYEVRTFMPNYGVVNERRNQLHEVIRLSGINISINDCDHPLIIKVASMHPARLQVYFIDNDDYFQKSDDDEDAIGSNRTDNDERTLFFTRGTMETAKKLSWNPDLIHAAGWFGALVPLYLKTVFNDPESFSNPAMIYTVLDEAPVAPIDPALLQKLIEDGVPAADVDLLRDIEFDDIVLQRIAIRHSDGVIFNTTTPDPRLLAEVEARGIPYLMLDPEADNGEAYHQFYTQFTANR